MLISANMAMPELESNQYADGIKGWAFNVMEAKRDRDNPGPLEIIFEQHLFQTDMTRFVDPLGRLSLQNPTDSANFGEGKAGKRAQVILQTVTCCEALAAKPCGQSPQLTLDYDVLGDLEQRAFCLDHLEPAMERIQADLAVTGRIASFGINGHGRT